MATQPIENIGVLKLRLAGLVCEQMENNPCAVCRKKAYCTTYCEEGRLWWCRTAKAEKKELIRTLNELEKRIMRLPVAQRAETRERRYNEAVDAVMFRRSELEVAEARERIEVRNAEE